MCYNNKKGMKRMVILAILLVLAWFSYVEAGGQDKKKITPDKIKSKRQGKEFLPKKSSTILPLDQIKPKTNLSEGTTAQVDEVKIKLFFPRDGYDNGRTGGEGQSLRNWFYYWKEGNVVSDLSQFDYRDTDGYYGVYSPSTDKLYVANPAPKSKKYSVTFINLYYKTFITSGPNGIADTSVKEGEDDIQVIPVGQGKPNAIAITAGEDNILNTSLSGDDTVTANAITTGPDGICQTTALGDDVQIIQVNKGEPNSVIITAGEDNFLRSSVEGDDQLDTSTAVRITHSVDFSGIDCCASTCAHELKHRENYRNGGRNLATDSDMDGVADAYEGKHPYYLDPKQKDTYNVAETLNYPPYARYGDDEFLARLAGENPGPTDPSKDWSDTNGKNWR